MANSKGSTANGSGTEAGTGSKDRADAIRIVNLKAVSERLNLSEQRIRNLVHEEKLATEQRTLEGTDISFTIVPDSAITEYLAKVAANVDGFSSRKRSVNHIAYVVYVPKDSNGDADPAILQYFTEQGLSFKLRNTGKTSDDSDDSDDTADDSAAANGSSTPSAATDNATLEANRNASVNASIPTA
jgi:hypothetical protein